MAYMEMFAKEQEWGIKNDEKMSCKPGMLGGCAGQSQLLSSTCEGAWPYQTGTSTPGKVHIHVPSSRYSRKGQIPLGLYT